MSATTQTKFVDPIDSSKQIIKQASELHEDIDTVVLSISGATDSLIAADLAVRFFPDYGDYEFVVMHANTGTAVPQSKLTAKVFADIHDLEFIEAGPRNPQDYLAVRVLNNGWGGGYVGSPATGGHGLEWANRKNKPMQAVYMQIDGMQFWVSGTRVTESDRRSVNLGSRAVDKDNQSPRRIWVSPIYSWDTADKIAYIKERGLPVSEAYEILGYSGECTACSFDDRGVLNDIEILSPELAYCIKTLAVWVGMRAVRGDIDIDPKQLCWGWDPEDGEDETNGGQELLTPELEETTAQEMVGCAGGNCSTRQAKPWMSEIAQDQIITREDTYTAWNESVTNVSQRFGLA